MVHCVSSSEPDSGGDIHLTPDDWRSGSIQPTTNNPGNLKDIVPLTQTPTPQQIQQSQQQQQSTPVQLSQQAQQQQQQQPQKPQYVESSTGGSIQVGSLVEQACAAGATRQLTLTDIHDQHHHQYHHDHVPADTTHDRHTPHEPLDEHHHTIIDTPPPPPLPPPNHSIHSDTIVIAERISEELVSCDDYLINKDAIREIQVQSTAADSLQRAVAAAMLTDDDYDDDDNNISDDQASQLAATAAAAADSKFYNLGITAGLYPHLYNFKEQTEAQQQQPLAVVNYQAAGELTGSDKLQAFFSSPYLYEQAAGAEGGCWGTGGSVAVELEEESTESSDNDEDDDDEDDEDEEDEEL